jgi:predicted TIM-barrel fold metal-dependent hydrolase
LTEKWKYKGPIFDAHTHIGEIETTEKMLKIEDEFGVVAQIGIVHSKEGFEAAKKQYPERFVFAKYLSLRDIAHYNVDPVIEDISRTKDEGYSLAKTWFGPRWRDYIEDVPSDFRIDSPKLDPVFQALEDNDLPLLIHVADPDTYFQLHYQDVSKYGTKEDNLSQLDPVMERHPKLLFQIPHFGAQPEIHRLTKLASWFDRFPNVILDTASSRWMARELSKDVKKARSFLIKYSDRILFGTDLSANRGDMEYFGRRYSAQRILWETDVRNEPLPFEDADTKDSGGTFINGLDLPLSVLRKLYWDNAIKTYGPLN